MKAIKTLKAVVIYNNIETAQPSYTTPSIMGSQPSNNLADMLFPEDKPDVSLPLKPPMKRSADEELEAPPVKKQPKRSIVLKIKTSSKTPATDITDATPKSEETASETPKPEDQPAPTDMKIPTSDEEAIIMHTKSEPEPATKDDIKALKIENEYLHKMLHQLQQEIADFKHKHGHHNYLSIDAAKRATDEDKKVITFPQFQRLDRHVQRLDRRFYAIETGQQMPKLPVGVLCSTACCEKPKGDGA